MEILILLKLDFNERLSTSKKVEILKFPNLDFWNKLWVLDEKSNSNNGN